MTTPVATIDPSAQTQKEIHLVVRIGKRLFKAVTAVSTESLDKGEPDYHLELFPITEPVTPATAADVDRFLEENNVPEGWKLVGEIAYGIVSDSWTNTAGVRYLSFKGGKWEKSPTSSLVFVPNIDILLGMFDAA